MRSVHFLYLLIFLTFPFLAQGRLPDAGSNRNSAPRGSGANTSGYAFMLNVPEAKDGTCLPFYKGNANEDLKRNGITVLGNPSESEKQALAQGITQIERLLGEPLPQRWHTPFKYNTHVENWRQTANHIEVNRGSASSGEGENLGRLMHELGHKVGNSQYNSQASIVYDSYKAHMKKTGGSCKMTGYCNHSNNEEFAEVFSAFVTHPEMLKKDCPQAYNFLLNQVFSTTANARKERNPENFLANCSNQEMMAQNKRAQSHFRFSKVSAPKNRRPSSKSRDTEDPISGRATSFGKTSSEQMDSSGIE